MSDADWVWTDRRIQAALDVAEDQLDDEQIADAAGVDRRTLARWKRHPEFAARVAELLEASYEACKQAGLASRQRRVQHLERRHAALREIIAERAEEYARFPGGGTGLIVAREVGIGGGDTVTVHEIDKFVLTELRAIENQIAVEAGQRVAQVKHDVSGDALGLLRTFLYGDGEEPGTGEEAVEVGAA